MTPSEAIRARISDGYSGACGSAEYFTGREHEAECILDEIVAPFEAKARELMERAREAYDMCWGPSNDEGEYRSLLALDDALKAMET